MKRQTPMGHLVIIACVLIACRSTAVPTLPTETPLPTLTATPSRTTVPTRTLTPSPVPTGTSTVTPVPTSTPTPTPIPPPRPTSPAAARELPAPPIALVVDPFDQLGLYALLRNHTLYHTGDNGETWRKMPLPAPERPFDSEADPDLPNAPSIWPQRDLVVTRVWPNHILLRVDQTLYRRDEGEARWTRLLDRVTAWAVDEAQGELLYAWQQGEPDQGGQETHGLYASQDGGETWEHAYQGFFPPQPQGQDIPGNHEGITSLAIDPAAPEILYAGTDVGLYRSLDGGRTWAPFEDGLPPTAPETRPTPLLVGGMGSGPIYALTEVSPEQDGTGAQVILARLERGPISPDGDHWLVVGQDVLQMLAYAEQGFWGVHTLAIDPVQPERLYLGSVQGLWRSADGGETWAPANLGGGAEARPVGAVYRIAVRPGEESELYLWSDTGLHVHTFSTPTIPREAISHEVQLAVVGQLGGQSRAVAVTADTVYLGIGPRIAGLGNTLPLLPDAGFTPSLPGMVNDIVLDDEATLAYVAAGQAGLLLVDVSTVSAARVVGAAETTYEAQAVAVVDGLAVVAQGRQGRGGVSIVDVSLPDMPWLRAQRKLPDEGRGVALADGYAYVVYEGGLLALDLSDPDNPAETARVRLPMCGADVVVRDGYAYVAADGLRVYDLSDPAQPDQIGHFETPFCINALGVQDELVYLCDVFCEMGGCGSKLYVVDVSQAAKPQEMGTWFSKSAVEDLSVYDGVAYLASRQNGVEAVDVSDPDNMQLLGAYSTLGEVCDVAVADGFAYVSDVAESGLRVLDLTPSPSGHVWPTVRGRVEVRWAGGYAIADGFAYVPAWQEGLYVLDARAPDNPVEVAHDPDLGIIEQVILVGDRAYVVASYYGLVILDIAEPGAPRILGELPLDGMDGGVAVRGEYALVTLDDGEQQALAEIDVRDPEALHEAGRASLDGHGRRLAVHGDHAYVAVLNWTSGLVRGGLQVVDVSDPEQPKSVGFLDLPNGAFDVAISGGYAFIAGDAAGVYVADLSDPAHPRLVGLADTAGTAFKVTSMEDQVYVADGAGGLLILALEPLSP